MSETNHKAVQKHQLLLLHAAYGISSISHKYEEFNSSVNKSLIDAKNVFIYSHSVKGLRHVFIIFQFWTDSFFLWRSTLRKNLHCTSTICFLHEKHILPGHSTLVQDMNFSKWSNMRVFPAAKTSSVIAGQTWNWTDKVESDPGRKEMRNKTSE